LKAEADQVTTVIPPRGIVTRHDLHAQLAELAAGSRHGRTDRPAITCTVTPRWMPSTARRSSRPGGPLSRPSSG
jgi:hypothetical protein